MLAARLFASVNHFCKNIIKVKDTLSLSKDSTQESEGFMRLSKWMSMKSLCSRKEAEEIINLGLVRIDGKRVFENMMVPVYADMKAFTPIGLHT